MATLLRVYKLYTPNTAFQRARVFLRSAVKAVLGIDFTNGFFSRVEPMCVSVSWSTNRQVQKVNSECQPAEKPHLNFCIRVVSLKNNPMKRLILV